MLNQYFRNYINLVFPLHTRKCVLHLRTCLKLTWLYSWYAFCYSKFGLNCKIKFVDNFTKWFFILLHNSISLTAVALNCTQLFLWTFLMVLDGSYLQFPKDDSQSPTGLSVISFTHNSLIPMAELSELHVLFLLLLKTKEILHRNPLARLPPKIEVWLLDYIV